MASCTAVDSARSGSANVLAATTPPGWQTRPASRSAASGIARELERVYSGDRAEKIVRERKFLQIAEPQPGVGDAVAGDGSAGRG